MSDGKSNEDMLKQLRNDYVAAFTSPQGVSVEDDLRIVCGADKSSFDVDPYVTAFNEGRRYIWLHIKHQKEKTDDRIMRLIKANEVENE